MANTVATKFLIISDTHNFKFGDAEKYEGKLILSTPKADVVLHCGDITLEGGEDHYKSFLRMMRSIDAELKLVIAGNHDRDLDRDHIMKIYHEEVAEDLHDRAIKVMKGPLAKDAGVTYLEEGLQTFTLSNGAKFTIYTSPYQPEFCGWAFPYERNEDRFNPPEHVLPKVKPIARNPIPDFPGVDIMMTHGPPAGIRDETSEEKNVGCQALLRAATRAKPRLYCFGHIHEAWGAEIVRWKDDESWNGDDGVESKTWVENAYPQSNQVPLRVGRETLMVNASIMNLGYKPENSPWLVELELPVSQ